MSVDLEIWKLIHLPTVT